MWEVSIASKQFSNFSHSTSRELFLVVLYRELINANDWSEIS